MQLNEAVRQARVDLGLSQKKLAEMAGVQRRQLATLETGGNVTLKTLRKVLVHLPNLTNFSIDTADGAVERGSEKPSQKSQAFLLGTDLILMVHHVLATVNAGKRAGREINALRRAAEGLRTALGYTPERLAGAREMLWADEFPGLPTLIAPDDETLMTETDEDEDDTEETLLEDDSEETLLEDDSDETVEEDDEDSIKPDPVP